MKKLIFAIFISVVAGIFALDTNAHGDKIDDHTIREEQEGKELWTKLQSEGINCASLSDEQFGALGEYFMGQMMRDSL